MNNDNRPRLTMEALPWNAAIFCNSQGQCDEIAKQLDGLGLRLSHWVGTTLIGKTHTGNVDFDKWDGEVAIRTRLGEVGNVRQAMSHGCEIVCAVDFYGVPDDSDDDDDHVALQYAIDFYTKRAKQ